ncbi:hypothetical protein ID866_8418 [Astraeus odoratus]|nr:hypothetical protein ID866_8418 [Astraeus odoratus]
MLNLMDRYDLPGEGRTGLNMHRIVEAQKFGFAARTRIGDTSYGSNNSARIAEISTKEYANIIAVNLTDDHTHPMEYYNPEFDIKIDHGTSHTSVVDKDGMAAALTTTVNLVFGSQVLDPDTGIILNDEMDDFSTPGVPNSFGLWPSPYNYPEPGKRPLSSIAPTIMEYEDGSFYLAIGGSGGSRIFPSVFQVILNLDWGQDISEAIEYGRVHDQLLPMEVDADDILPDDLLKYLRDRGHNVTVKDTGRVAGVIQSVLQKDGRIYGVIGPAAVPLFTCPSSSLLRKSVTTRSFMRSFQQATTKQPRPGMKSLLAPDDDDDEAEDVPERLSSGDAWIFPIVGSIALICTYLIIKNFGKDWLNWFLAWYASLMGALCFWRCIVSLARLMVGEDRWKRFGRVRFVILNGPLEEFSLSLRKPTLLLFPVSTIPSVLYVWSPGNRKPIILTNILALALSHNALSFMKLDSFRTGCILLSGLFFYDIYWVFGSKLMLEVATSLDVPIKILWPRSLSSTAEKVAMLGLGDIVIPGTFIALALRYDHARAKNIKGEYGKLYFSVTLTSYVAGLLATMAVVHLCNRAQPALLYLSPACILSFLVTAFVRGEFREAWAWSDDPEQKKNEHPLTASESERQDSAPPEIRGEEDVPHVPNEDSNGLSDAERTREVEEEPLEPRHRAGETRPRKRKGAKSRRGP